MDKKGFGQWIKSIRNECGYTQAKMAELLGLEQSQSIANIEAGRAMLPKKSYRKFIQEFRVDADTFLNMILKVKTNEMKSDIEDYIYGRKR